MRGRKVLYGGRVYTILHTVVDFDGYYAVWVVTDGRGRFLADSRDCVLD